MRVIGQLDLEKMIPTLSWVWFVLSSSLFVYLGQVNSDEGWYLYASQLVYAGQLPYRDFAFTQTPLLPYVYGVAQQLFSSSIYLGRIVTVLCSAMAFWLGAQLAGRYGGALASAVTALLGATFTYGIYFQSITKTYALTTLLCVLAWFVLHLRLSRGWRLSLMTLCVLLATLTRLSALMFAVPFIAYALWTASRRERWLLIALCLSACLWLGWLGLPNVEALQWGLLTHHTAQWGDRSVLERVVAMLTVRAPLLFAVFPAYILLWGVLLCLGYRQIRISFCRQPTLLVTLIGLLLFALPNLASGGFYGEYFAPFFFIAFPLTGIAYAQVLLQRGRYAKIVLKAALLATCVLGLARGGFDFIDTSGGTAPVEEIKTIATVVAANSTSDEQLFALEALVVAIEARRRVLPNQALAQFSFSDGDTAAVERLHLLNAPMVWSYLETRLPKIVMLTDTDWLLWQHTVYAERIAATVKNHYELIYQGAEFGQYRNRIEVYRRRND